MSKRIHGLALAALVTLSVTGGAAPAPAAIAPPERANAVVTAAALLLALGARSIRWLHDRRSPGRRSPGRRPISAGGRRHGR